MIEHFLKAKHWQLFLLIFGIPFVLNIILVINIISGLAIGCEPDFVKITDYFKYIPVIAFISATFQYGWFWSTGNGLQKAIPNEFKMQTGFFKFSVIFPFVYIMIFVLVFMLILGTIMYEPFNPIGLFGAMAIVVPLHFFAMFCSIYCIYFVARTYKTAELKRKVTFGDYIGEFFLIWFYPIGVWIIQPGINKLANQTEHL